MTDEGIECNVSIFVDTMRGRLARCKEPAKKYSLVKWVDELENSRLSSLE